jgi:molecular chaperone HscB
MNYFELYDIPVSMKPDVQQVKQKFYELSRRYHPDFYTNASDQEQAEVLETSSLVNKAFKVFQQPDETIKYVLQLHGLLEEEEKYQLPGSFLAEMLDLNEQIADAKMEGDAAALQQVQNTIHDIQSDLYEPVKQIVEHYQEGVTTKEELLQVKDYYYKKKYLTRILAGIH